MQVPITAKAEAHRLRLRGAMAGCADYAEMHGIKGAAPILRRVAENATKIALVSAVGRSPFKPLITMDDFDIGHVIARWSARVMIRNIALFVADNETERNVNAIERLVLTGGTKGIVWRRVVEKTRRMKTQERNDAINVLIEQGVLRCESTPAIGGGHATKRYFAVAAK
jgi:hypothetical protein